MHSNAGQNVQIAPLIDARSREMKGKFIWANIGMFNAYFLHESMKKLTKIIFLSTAMVVPVKLAFSNPQMASNPDPIVAKRKPQPLISPPKSESTDPITEMPDPLSLPTSAENTSLLSTPILNVEKAPPEPVVAVVVSVETNSSMTHTSSTVIAVETKTPSQMPATWKEISATSPAITSSVQPVETLPNSVPKEQSVASTDPEKYQSGSLGKQISLQISGVSTNAPTLSSEVAVSVVALAVAASETPAIGLLEKPVVAMVIPQSSENSQTPEPAPKQSVSEPGSIPVVASVVVSTTNQVSEVLSKPSLPPVLSQVGTANVVAIASAQTLPAQPKKVRVRLTFYSGKDDQWGSRVAWQEVDEAKRGRTVAADPTVFPYGTWIDIPGFGKHRVEDTGSAVKTRKASGGKDPVIDIYVAEESEVKRLASSTPEYVEITLL